MARLAGHAAMKTDVAMPPPAVWPEMPAMPPHEGFALMRMALPAKREARRSHARAGVLAVLRSWGFPAATLIETPQGPATSEADAIAVSLSYAGDSAWVCFSRQGRVGIDACVIADFPEMEQVARLYLREQHDLTAGDRAQAFAVAWSRHEAALKQAGIPLSEDAPLPRSGMRIATLRTGDTVVSVAFDGCATR
jgi:hypothetical protein